jgi:hypothetical protein
MYRIPQQGDPLEEVVAGPLEDGRHTAGPGHYETLVEVGRHDDVPLLTFTSPHGVEHVEHNAPSQAYLSMLETGLRESRGWQDDEVAEYFEAIVPG